MTLLSKLSALTGPDRLEARALAWAAKNMREGQYADDCYYVKSGFAVHGLPDSPNACLCREVPKTYAPFLKAKGIDNVG